jgi:uncharacterized protein YqjF (DUF2071 family)
MIWSQHWNDVLFLHWRMPPRVLQRLLPSQLDVDTFDGDAWISYVLFRLKLRLAGLPFVPGFSSLLELNLRTYVRQEDVPGITFLSMHADNRLAIAAARLLTPLPYQHARILYQSSPDGGQRVECSDGNAAGKLSLRFKPRGQSTTATGDSLDAWLVERYRLFVSATGGGVIEADVDHPPWPISAAECDMAANSLSESLGISLSTRPDLAHFSPGVSVRFNAFRADEATQTSGVLRPCLRVPRSRSRERAVS